jgi:hypothetical protein
VAIPLPTGSTAPRSGPTTSLATLPAERRPSGEVAIGWYGSETLLVDAISIVTTLVGAATVTAEVGALGGLGYHLGSPIVHWSHGNVGEGFGSLAMRLAATVVLVGGADACFGSHRDDEALRCGVAILGIVAIPAVIAVDAAVFAYDEEPTTEELASSRFVPWVNRERSATGVMWLGRF